MSSNSSDSGLKRIGTYIVITGRNASPRILELADAAQKWSKPGEDIPVEMEK
jgi:hypothetical protein